MGFTFKVLLRKNINNNCDKMYIACRIIINRNVKFYFLKLIVKEKDWNDSKFKVNCSDLNSILKNQVIDNWLERLNKLYFEYKKPEFSKNIDFKQFEQDFFNTKLPSKSFYNFIEDEIVTLRTLRAEGTVDNYQKLLVKLKGFREQLKFDEVDQTIVEKFHIYLYGLKKANHEPLDLSTIYKFHKDFRMFTLRYTIIHFSIQVLLLWNKLYTIC